MRIIILSVSLLLYHLHLNAQFGWVSKKVGKEVSVSFPKEPTSDTKPERKLALYTLKSGNSQCMFSVMVRGDAISDYERIKNLSQSDEEKEINSFLEKGIAQFILDSKIISPSKAIKIGAYSGKEITYSQLNDKTGKWFTQFTRFVFAENNLYIIQCSMYQEGACITEKNIFLNSITPN